MLAYDGGPYWAEQTIAMLNDSPYAEHDLDYIAYEGGQHLFNYEGSPNDDVSQLFVEANRHERMGELYTRYLDWWRDAGGGLFVLYTHTARPGQGSFGLLEYLEQDTLTAPKWLAVQAWLRANRSSSEATSARPPDTLLDPWARNYPNPFRGATTIEYVVDEPGHVRIQVFDVTGRLVRVLEDGVRPSGRHTVGWAASDLPPGVYIYGISTQGSRRVRSVIVVR